MAIRPQSLRGSSLESFQYAGGTIDLYFCPTPNCQKVSIALEGVLAAYHTRPLPGLANVALTFGGGVTLGFHDTSADAHQRNRCQVEFAGAPGIHQCSAAVQDFTLDFHPDDTGFEYALDGLLRLDYRLDSLLRGLRVGIVCQVGYGGMAQFNAPTNLIEDGPPRLDWDHVVQQRAGAELSLFF